MKRVRTANIYKGLDLPQAYAVFLANLADGDEAEARRVADAVGEVSFAVRRSRLAELHERLGSVTRAVEELVLPDLARLDTLRGARLARDVLAKYTVELGPSMYLAGVQAATDDALAVDAALEEADEIRQALEPFKHCSWMDAEERAVMDRAAAVLQAFDHVCQVVGVAPAVVAKGHALVESPLFVELRARDVPADLSQRWRDDLLRVWFNQQESSPIVRFQSGS